MAARAAPAAGRLLNALEYAALAGTAAGTIAGVGPAIAAGVVVGGLGLVVETALRQSPRGIAVVHQIQQNVAHMLVASLAESVATTVASTVSYIPGVADPVNATDGEPGDWHALSNAALFLTALVPLGVATYASIHTGARLKQRNADAGAPGRAPTIMMGMSIVSLMVGATVPLAISWQGDGETAFRLSCQMSGLMARSFTRSFLNGRSQPAFVNVHRDGQGVGYGVSTVTKDARLRAAVTANATANALFAMSAFGLNGLQVWLGGPFALLPHGETAVRNPAGVFAGTLRQGVLVGAALQGLENLSKTLGYFAAHGLHGEGELKFTNTRATTDGTGLSRPAGDGVGNSYLFVLNYAAFKRRFQEATAWKVRIEFSVRGIDAPIVASLRAVVPALVHADQYGAAMAAHAVASVAQGLTASRSFVQNAHLVARSLADTRTRPGLGAGRGADDRANPGGVHLEEAGHGSDTEPYEDTDDDAQVN